ncbi:unnamed protein product, partial [Mesorhabditis spiculigera]
MTEPPSFMRNLPSHNPENFSKMKETEETTARPPIAWHVPTHDGEQTIKHDRIPFLLKYLEQHFSINKPDKPSTSTSTATALAAIKRNNAGSDTDADRRKSRRVADD